MKLKIVFSALFLLMLGQFLYANFIHALGPSYTIQTAGFNRDNNQGCNSQGLCNTCPLLTSTTIFAPPIVKGFPFNDSYFYNPCGDTPFVYKASDFTLAKVLNALYIVIITALFGLVIYKQRKGKERPKWHTKNQRVRSNLSV